MKLKITEMHLKTVKLYQIDNKNNLYLCKLSVVVKIIYLFQSNVQNLQLV